MRALVIPKYPRPKALQLGEVPKPVPKAGEVLIRVHAAAVNSTDPVQLGSPNSRSGFAGGKPQVKYTIPGDSLAGEIESAGRDVRSFKRGERVFASTGMKLGAHAEYICLPENGALALMPAGMTFAEAAAIVDGGITAVTFLRDAARVRAGQQVLIHGASGSVGTFAVQLARHYGAHVTGVCSTSNLDLVRSLGAEQVLDYTAEDFTQRPAAYDIIFDTVAKSSFARCQEALKPGGIYLTTFPAPSVLLQRLWPRPRSGKTGMFAAAGLRSSRKKAEMLRFIRELADAGKIRAVIDRRHPLEEAPEAYWHVAQGHKKGSVVLTLSAAGSAGNGEARKGPS